MCCHTGKRFYSIDFSLIINVVFPVSLNKIKKKKNDSFELIKRLK